jgi:hypothetical protein
MKKILTASFVLTAIAVTILIFQMGCTKNTGDQSGPCPKDTY